MNVTEVHELSFSTYHGESMICLIVCACCFTITCFLSSGPPEMSFPARILTTFLISDPPNRLFEHSEPISAALRPHRKLDFGQVRPKFSVISSYSRCPQTPSPHGDAGRGLGHLAISRNKTKLRPNSPKIEFSWGVNPASKRAFWTPKGSILTCFQQ